MSGNDGVGINNVGELLTVTNSTVSGNSEGSFHASHLENDGPEPVTLSLTNSTVLGDITAQLYLSDVSVTNTVFVGACSLLLFDTRVLSRGYNIESPGNTCGFDPDGTDQVNVTPEELNLGELADNDGPTLTHKPGDGGLRDGSAAIDQIPEAACEVETDQRGEPRPAGPDPKRCDVGSVEVQR